MSLQNIIDSFNQRKVTYLNNETLIKAKIERLNRKLDRNQKQRPFVVQDILIPLAKELKERLGLKAYEIYGPFGLENETSIYLANEGKDGNIPICEVETWSLTLHWRYKKDSSEEIDHLEYWTGEQTNEFATGTIGWLNGYNHIFKPLPTDIDEIIKCLRHSTKSDK